MGYFEQPHLLMYTFNFLTITDLMNIHGVNQLWNKLSSSDIVWRSRLAQFRQIQSIDQSNNQNDTKINTIDTFNEQLRNQAINQTTNQSFDTSFNQPLHVIARECLRCYLLARGWPTNQIKLAQATIVQIPSNIQSTNKLKDNETDEKSNSQSNSQTNNQSDEQKTDASLYRVSNQSSDAPRSVYHCQFSFVTWRYHDDDDEAPPTMDYTEFIEFEISPSEQSNDQSNDQTNKQSNNHSNNQTTVHVVEDVHMTEEEQKQTATPANNQPDNQTATRVQNLLHDEGEQSDDDDEDEYSVDSINRSIDRSNLPFKVSRIGMSGSGWRADVLEPNLHVDDGLIVGMIDHSNQSNNQSINGSIKTAQSVYLSALKCSCSSVYDCSTIVRPYPRLPPPGLTPRQVSEIHLTEMRLQQYLRQAAANGIQVDMERLRRQVPQPHKPPPGQSICARPVCKNCLKRVALALETLASAAVWWHHAQLAVTRLIRINDVEWDVRFKWFEDEVEMCRVVLEPLNEEERKVEQHVREEYEKKKETQNPSSSQSINQSNNRAVNLSINGFEIIPVDSLLTSTNESSSVHPIVIVPRANQSKRSSQSSNESNNQSTHATTQSLSEVKSDDEKDPHRTDQSINQSMNESDFDDDMDEHDDFDADVDPESSIDPSDSDDEPAPEMHRELAALRATERAEEERVRAAVRAAAAYPMCDGWRFRRMFQGGSGRFALSGADNLPYHSPCPPEGQSVMHASHQHPLWYYENAPYRHGNGFGCDVCSEHGTAHVWHCSDCQFDVCASCFRHAEGNENGNETENEMEGTEEQKEEAERKKTSDK